VGKRYVRRSCPDCGAEFLLKYKDPSGQPSTFPYLYCIECDQLWHEYPDGRLIGAVKTQEPYADLRSLGEALRMGESGGGGSEHYVERQDRFERESEELGG